ncbi:unnamed protein product [Leuciscus chuanchicus]
MRDTTFPPAPTHPPTLTAHHYTQATTGQFVHEALVPTLPAELFSSSPALQWQAFYSFSDKTGHVEQWQAKWFHTQPLSYVIQVWISGRSNSAGSSFQTAQPRCGGRSLTPGSASLFLIPMGKPIGISGRAGVRLYLVIPQT